MTSPSVPTIKRLFALSGNQCAFPSCLLPIVDQPSGKVTGRICHIKAKQPGGPRYDPNQSDDERHSFDNLLLLCPIHHDVIDSDTESYTVERLIQIKSKHENGQTQDKELNDQLAIALIANIGSNSISGGSILFGQNQTGGQMAHQINNFHPPSDVSAALERNIKAQRDAHDTEIFRYADMLLNEEVLDSGFSLLLGDHSYYESFRNPIIAFCDFFNKAQNEYLNSNLSSLSEQLTSSLKELLKFIGIHFFIYPENQKLDNTRYCLYPLLNIDRMGSGDPEEMWKYDNYADQLQAVVSKASKSYVSYRRAIKETLFL